jgi:hypothetical protein
MPEEIHATNEIDINVEIDDKRTAESQDIDTATKDLITDMKGGSKGGGMGMGLDLPLAFGGVEGAKQLMQKGKGGAMNPMGMLMQQLPQIIMKALPKMVLKAIPIIGVAVLAAEIVPMIIKELVKQLTKAGSPFDKRFKRNMQREQNAFFNREEQRRRQLGLSPVIISTNIGFVNNGGNNMTATLKQVRQNGIATIGLQDKAIGIP